MLETKSVPSRLNYVVLGIILGTCLVGALLPFYADFMGTSIVRLASLPLLFLLVFLLAYSRIWLLSIILLLRSGGDNVFDVTKISIGSLQIGVGGLINAFVILITLLLIVEKPKVIPKGTLKIWAVFLIVALYGVVISPSLVEGIRLYLGLLSNFAIFLAAFYLVRSPDDYKKCVWIVISSSLIPAAYGFFQALTGAIPNSEDGLRLQSTFGHPNILAFYLTLVISLILYVLKSHTFALPAGKRWMLMAYLLLLVVLLILTKTRSAWAACFGMFVLYGILFERRYLIYLLLLSVIAFFIPGVNDRLLDLASGNEVVQYAKLNSFAWRVYLWQSSFEWMTTSHYFLGYGLDSFKYYAPIFFPLANNTNYGSHSVYVQLFFELGMVGLLAFIWLFYQLIKLLRPMLKLDKLSAFFLAVLIVEYLTVSFSDNMLYYLSFNWYFWFMLGAACAVVARSSSGNGQGLWPASH